MAKKVGCKFPFSDKEKSLKRVVVGGHWWRRRCVRFSSSHALGPLGAAVHFAFLEVAALQIAAIGASDSG